MGHIREARAELGNLIHFIVAKKPRWCPVGKEKLYRLHEGNLQVSLEHAYGHMNTAWNARHLSAKQYQKACASDRISSWPPLTPLCAKTRRRGKWSHEIVREKRLLFEDRDWHWLTLGLRPKDTGLPFEIFLDTEMGCAQAGSLLTPRLVVRDRAKKIRTAVSLENPIRILAGTSIRGRAWMKLVKYIRRNREELRLLWKDCSSHMDYCIDQEKV